MRCIDTASRAAGARCRKAFDDIRDGRRRDATGRASMSIKGIGMKNKIIQFPHAARIYGAEHEIVAEVMTITPQDATNWLRCNRNNRPLRKRHVAFLASEILNGNWQVNGQAIVIADDEQVLDGQHRLFAIIEAGQPIKTLVVYGITPEAFKTIDTGAVRSGADAMCLYFHDVPPATIKAVATAVQWCSSLERRSVGCNEKMSNTDVISYVKDHPGLLQCAETLTGFPKDARPMSIGVGAALYEMFARKDEDGADIFMERFYTGEGLIRTDPEWLLRQRFNGSRDGLAKLPTRTRVRMVIKGWNWLRRGHTEASAKTIGIAVNEDQTVVIF